MFYDISPSTHTKISETTWEGKEQVTPTASDLEELLNSSNDAQLVKFAEKWFPFTSRAVKGFPVDPEQNFQVIKDIQPLMQLISNLAQLCDADICSQEALEQLGFHFEPATKSIPKYQNDNYVFEESPEEAFRYSVCWLVLSDYLANNLQQSIVYKSPLNSMKGSAIKEYGMYLPAQRKVAETLADDELYRVYRFSFTYFDKDADALKSWIGLTIDEIMTLFLRDISISVINRRIELWPSNNLQSFWLLLSEQLSTTRIVICKTCGAFIFAGDERGTNREFCKNESCKRRFYRAKQFRQFVVDGMAEKEASKKASISAKTARVILARNNLV